MMSNPSFVPDEESEAEYEARAAEILAARKARMAKEKYALAGTSPQRRFTAAEIFDAEYPPIEYVVPGIIAPGVTLLVGPPKLGKSWLALDMAVAVASDATVLGNRQCAGGAVLYAALEDNQRRLQNRLRKLCANGPPARLSFVMEMAALDNGGEETLRDWINETPDARLIIVDVLTKVRPSTDKGESLYQYDYRCIAPLKQIADECAIAVVAVHHTRKAESSDWLTMTSGTNGLTGAADTTVALIRESAGVTLYGRGRDVADFELAMDFDREACRWLEMGVAEVARLSDERKAVLKALGGATEPLGPQAIADATGSAPGAVRVLLGDMVRDGQIMKLGRGCYALPDKPR